VGLKEVTKRTFSFVERDLGLRIILENQYYSLFHEKIGKLTRLYEYLRRVDVRTPNEPQFETFCVFS